jgi:hypothetical protein
MKSRSGFGEFSLSNVAIDIKDTAVSVMNTLLAMAHPCSLRLAMVDHRLLVNPLAIRSVRFTNKSWSASGYMVDPHPSAPRYRCQPL